MIQCITMKSLELSQNNSDTSPDTVYRFLSRTGFIELLSDEHKFREWITNVSAEEFEEHLVRINGILREIKIKDRAVDGHTVELSSEFTGTSYLPPTPEDKKVLIQTAFEKAKTLNSKDAGLLIYFTLQAVHPFLDGNGRTGRLVYLLLESNANGHSLSNNDIVSFLKHEGETGQGRKLFEKKVRSPEKVYEVISLILARAELSEETLDGVSRVYSALQAGAVGFENDQMTLETKTKLEKLCAEGGSGNISFRDIVLVKFVENKKFDEKYFKKNTEKKLLIVDGEKIFEELSEYDALELISLFQEMKKSFCERIIDVIANSAEYKFIDGKTVKDTLYV